jgi:hypothetical protein
MLKEADLDLDGLPATSVGALPFRKALENTDFSKKNGVEDGLMFNGISI